MTPRSFCLLASIFLPFISAHAQDGDARSIRVTHGPILGQPTSTSMSIWVRTNDPGEVKIFYGTKKENLDQTAPLVTTAIEHDNTGITKIDGLKPGTKYFYRVEDHQLSGSFTTWKSADDFRNAEGNPKGLFNLRFEFACGNNQRAGGNSVGPTLPVYDILNSQVRDTIDFAILNGDWLYEDRREYLASRWLHQVGLTPDQTPSIVKKAPTIVGVWENYKIFLERGRNLSEWHRHVPSFYTADDHELLNDIYGTAEVGYVNRRAVFRDIATRAWFDYLAWSNPVEHEDVAWFGRAKLKAGSDILEDPDADFGSLDLGKMANLLVHWGTDTAGVADSDLDSQTGDPNAAVYEIVEVLGKNKLRINPPAKADGDATAYSIGRRCYGKFTVSNCDFFLLDTRSHRDLHDVDNPDKPGASMLGKQQLKWLKDGISNSEADFIFVVSSVNFMVPHVGSGGGDDKQLTIKKDDAWTVFLDEREELIEFWDKLDQPVFVLTGDLHNSFAIRVTDNVYEFASGPHNSINHTPPKDEGNRPVNGKFKYGPRECEIRWSSYAMEDIPRANRTFPHYCVVQVNNVFNNPVERDGERWFAYPHPQVIFQFFDGLTGELRYSETIVKGLNK
ncbi:MAG: alkaline phosphatase [Verrucomicrobiales bacterium]|nr:alkaline phosphatase [Verrucomicrobiales bacterium]